MRSEIAMMEMIEGVIFDFNGTLFFDADKHMRAWNQIVKDIAGRAITKKELRIHMNGKTNDEIIRYFAPTTYPEEKIAYYAEEKEVLYRKYCKEDTKTLHLVPGATKLFDSLKAKDIPFTIASASIKSNIDFFVRTFHLDAWIEPSCIVYDDGTYASKTPMFKKAASILGSSKATTLIFEDSHVGIYHAYEAGFTNIIVVCEKEYEGTLGSMPGVVATIRDFEAFFD